MVFLYWPIAAVTLFNNPYSTLLICVQDTSNKGSPEPGIT